MSRASVAKKRYLRELKLYLCVDKHVRDQLLSEISADIDVFLSENKYSTIKSLYKQFGKPVDVAMEFAKRDDVAFTRRRKIINIILTILIVLVLAYLSVLLIVYIDTLIHGNGHIIIITNGEIVDEYNVFR